MLEVVEKYRIQSFHLSFTQGTWDDHQWGIPILHSHPSGVELWAYISDKDGNVDDIWKRMTHALAGLFCASLNFMKEDVTAVPELSFSRPIQNGTRNGNLQLRYALLPREIVCTENLTPWIKLLPCLHKSGLASILNPYRLYKSLYHSMAIDMEYDGQWHLKQSVVTVFDKKILSGDRSFSWSLSSFFNRTVLDRCRLASKVVVMLSTLRLAEQSGLYTLLVPPSRTIDGHLHIYTGDQVRENIGMTFDGAHSDFHSLRGHMASRVIVDRHLLGYGQERGILKVKIANVDPSHAFHFTYMDVLPWQMHVYMHTFKLTAKSLEYNLPVYVNVSQMLYSPCIPRVRPTLLETSLILPPSTQVTISFAFEKVFMKYNEYPFDPNRGFDIGSARVTVHMPQSALKGTIHTLFRMLSGCERIIPVVITTPTLLLTLPIPDFTMPFNVITLTFKNV